MRQILPISVFAIIFNLTTQAQIKNSDSKEIKTVELKPKENLRIVPKNNLDNSDSMEISLNQIAEGFGPKGNSSSGIASKNRIDSLEQSAYPKMKNIPNNLTNVVEYCYVLNHFQFFYQNYRNGFFSKDYFLKEATKQKWDLKDTLLLTNKNLKNTISIATGFNSEGTPMYIIDSQNNGDFSDDALNILLSKSNDQEEVVSNSCSVDIESFNGEYVKSEKQLVFVGLNRGKEIMFSFPQFRYGKFNYKDKNYLISAESVTYESQTIYVLDDKPYFSDPGRKKQVKPYQYVELGGDYFQYIPKSQNSEKVQFLKVPRPKGTSLLVSNQVAMLAPEIKGLDILNDANISLNSIKGKYVFIDFWSTSCGPCIMEFPNIAAVYEKFDRSQLEIIGVADDRTGGKIKEFIQNKKLSWPNINMNIRSTTIQGYHVVSFPTTYLIDPNGVIIATNLRGNDLLNKLQSLKIGK